MKVLVADDEQLARHRLVEMLHEIDADLQVLAAGDGLTGLQLAQQQAPEVALLDIRMPGIDGINLALRLSELPRPPTVVFVTAYDDHALAAFQANAIAYLLKPIRLERLREALHKAVLFSRAQQQVLAVVGAEDAALSATLGGRLLRIPLSQVIYLRADQKYVEVCHEAGTALLDESLRSIEERFPGAFLRIHRNALVAPARLRELVRERGVPLLGLQGSSTQLEVSRRHLPEVRRRLKDSAPG